MTDRGTQFHPSWDTASGFQSETHFESATAFSTPHTDFGAVGVKSALDGAGLGVTITRPRDIYVWNGSAWILPTP